MRRNRVPKNVQTNYRDVQIVLFVLFLANMAVAILKLIVGASIHSSSLTADGFHSLSDGSSNVVGMIGIYFASRPKDEKHPYGHSKLETLASLVIGLFLAFTGGKVVFEAIGKFQEPVKPSITSASLIALVATLVVNLFVTLYEHHKGVELDSAILISDAMHTRADIFVSLGVLATLTGIRLGLPPIIDPIASFVVSLFIFRTAWEVIYENTNILIDAAPIDMKIRELVSSMDNVRSVHKIRSRGTHNDIHIDMHIHVHPDMTIRQGHNLQHDIEQRIRDEINPNAHVLVHVEPASESEERQEPKSPRQ